MTITVGVNIKGEDKTHNRWRLFRKDYVEDPSTIMRMLDNVGKEWVRASRKRVPVFTGELLAGLHYTINKDDDVFQLRMRSSADYGAEVEAGIGLPIMRPVTEKMKLWAKSKRYNKALGSDEWFIKKFTPHIAPATKELGLESKRFSEEFISDLINKSFGI